MDSRLDENQSELAVDVLTVAFQMLADADGALDEEVKILGDVWFQADGFHNTEHFVAVHEPHLSNSVRVTKDDS